jgi:L-ascorbate metabolism protein UlaG (beta-lactamase superfamily)
MASLTWLGHGSFRLDTAGGARIYLDPWLSGPTTPDREKNPDRADAIAVTHGHGDHAGDVVGLHQKLGCSVLGTRRRSSGSTRAGRSRSRASSSR